jgi:hypothetical protein
MPSIEQRKKASAHLAAEVAKIAALHPKYAAALLAISKEAAGWMPGELRDDGIWESGHVDQTPTTHKEEGSQVPPARTMDGEQLDAKGNPVSSIHRTSLKEAMSIEAAWDGLARMNQERRNR